MFLRFVIYEYCANSRKRLGIFGGTWVVQDAPETPPWVIDQVEEHLDWFNKNLAVPRSLRFGNDYEAVCWFKNGAREHLRRAWSLKWLLEDQGVWVEFLRTGKPGRVTYEDTHQVVAVPWRDADYR